ncbi:LysR substrate-binding domain-containing protein [Cupriavidus pinatubonensis]|nr:LysR substrate-binding domain-containing protein [Cupriavidus pinatubonensis]
MLEASARHGSFARAAEELSVTESAVYRQIVALEQRYGVCFFQRAKKRISLTSEGARYVNEIREQLQQIERATKELAARAGGKEVVELAVVPTFAAQWLIPRLSSFARQYPRLLVNITARADPFHLHDSRFDAAIYFGHAVWPGTTGSCLFSEGPSIPVCSPSFPKHEQVLTRQDVTKLPLIHLASRPDAWPNWLGGDNEDLRLAASQGSRFDLFTMVVSAAVSGLGAALLPKILIHSELERGLLVPLLRDTQDDIVQEGSYFISHRTDQMTKSKIDPFLSWLVEESESGMQLT